MTDVEYEDEERTSQERGREKLKQLREERAALNKATLLELEFLDGRR